MRLTMLMPNLPSLGCGIADHSLLLGKALKPLGYEVDYLARHGGGERADREDLHLWSGGAGNLAAMIHRLGTEVLWVQYSGYGFSSKGTPFGLARALKRLRRSKAAPIVAICMHETHANLAHRGWLASVLQKLQLVAARRVARSGDVLFATVDANLRRCVEEYGVAPGTISLLPISSNIPRTPLRPGDRAAFRRQLGLADGARIAAVFGLWPTQLRTLAMFGDDLDAGLRQGRIDHVVAVGGGTERPAVERSVVDTERFDGQITVLGPAPALEIARILRCCDIGLVPTPPDYARKSGVVAAFVAADLELWLKNGHAELVVEQGAASFPEWEELACLASGRVATCLGQHEHGN